MPNIQYVLGCILICFLLSIYGQNTQRNDSKPDYRLCVNLATSNYRSICKKFFTVYVLVILDEDSEDVALSQFQLFQPMLDPCIEKESDPNEEGKNETQITQSQVMFLREDGNDYQASDCKNFQPFDYYQNATEFPKDLLNNPLFSFYNTWNWGLNDIGVLRLLKKAVDIETNCNKDKGERQAVIFIFLNMDQTDAIDRFSDLDVRWTDTMLQDYPTKNIIMKIFWTKSNLEMDDNVKTYLEKIKQVTQGFVDHVNDTLKDQKTTKQQFGMCTTESPTPSTPEHQSPIVALSVGIGGFLLILMLTVVVVVVLFTQTSLLNRPAYLFFRFLENRLKLKFAFLVKIHQEFTDAGFDRYVQAYRRGEDEWEVDPQNLHISTEKLGSGSAGMVFMGILSGLPPVAKIYPGAQLVGNYARDENPVAIKKPHDNSGAENRIEFLQEIRFMKSLGFHPHVLTMLGCYIYPLHPLIVTELCEFGDLLTNVRLLGDPKTKANAPFEVEVLPVMAWQICDALSFLASIGIIHRDVAARNVLVNKAKVAKLSDFGLCRKSDDLMYSGKKVTKLPLKWMAPEAIEKAEYSHKSDMWSYGVVLYEIFSYGTVPYPSISSEAVLEFVKKGNRLDVPPDTPTWLEPLMELCWEEQPSDRPMASDLKASLYANIENATNSYGYLQMNLENHMDDPENEEIEIHDEEEPFKVSQKHFDSRF